MTFITTTFHVVGTETEDGNVDNFDIQGTYTLDGNQLTATFTEENQEQIQTATYAIDDDKLSLTWSDSDSADIYTRQ